MKTQDQQFDLTRDDKRYTISIPSYKLLGSVVLYQVKLKDLIENKQYTHQFRFKQLKQYHQDLTELKLELPQFPKTHFWKKTNKNPELIQDRRIRLQAYFKIVINDRYTRGNPAIKKFVHICKTKSGISKTKSCKSITSNYSSDKKFKSLEKKNLPIKITFSLLL